jgi:hypothetical protein
MKKMSSVFHFFVGLMLSFGAHAALVNLGAPTGSSQADGVWYTDRYAPSGWTESGGVLSQVIDAADRAANRPSAYSGSFYNTQGRKYDLAAGVTSVSVELFTSGDPLQQRLAGFWATGVDASNQAKFFPIIDFAADGVGPRFQGWNGAGFTNYGLPTSFAYDAWHELKIVLRSADNEFDYLLDNVLLGSVGANGSVAIANLMFQGYNNFKTDVGNYEILWTNAQTNLVENNNNVPEPGSLALMFGGLGIMSVVRRKTVPVSA